MQLLKRQQAKASTINDAFFYAARKGDLDEVMRLLGESGNGLHIDTKNSVGKTALMIAADEGREDVVEYLCEQGADTTLQDMGAYTALNYAQNYNRKKTNRRKIVKILENYSCK